MQIRSYGKFNLTLKVSRKSRLKKMHRIQSIIFPYKLEYDMVEVLSYQGQQTIFTCNRKELDWKNNTVLDAYHKFVMMFPKFKAVPLHINLIKKTTIGSGLGYSASNAVALIKIICNFFKINYHSKKIKKLIKSLSSDALFFYLEKPAIISGYGNKITYLTPNQIKKYEIANLKVIDSKISSITKDVYQEFDYNYQYYKTKKNINIYYNMLQQPAFKINPKLKKFYLALKKEHQNVMLSGSGGAFLVW
ncbi:4-diphosphocytidyl-2C-methyl-D-erythritol kinase [Spiroplasma sp. SV19]|uniref:GHMP family kinase ATP-binding protein n=1 Tax=Spiroplasma sp. SV19 TaxID=2570468 RepID=UPI0024B836E3|nr:4-diphosphocytidyl-2C-methyl-D-erythritol kinase [Spiroplasma sp. SV19]WHQ37164.1 4-diphosphocytidyl-2C-methyl-D-erythritol kinase [Spiroplasma sp. SV19]